jgi:serine/threonine protein phosphatase PrpC
MEITGVGLTDVGRKRNHNEDFVLLRPDLGLYLVADGMGGHAAGEVASRLAADVVTQYIEGQRHVLERFDDSAASREALLKVVREGIEAASRDVYRLATSDQGRAGMGTTLTMMLVLGEKGVMGHVGDSRLYLCRGGKLHQLSDDHSYLSELVRRGHITAEKAEKSPYSNVITRAVGIQSSVQVDTLFFDILPDDTYLLCSDGLTRYVEDEEEMVRLATGEEELSDATPKKLIEVANERGGKDNITALVVRAERQQTRNDDVRSTEVNLQVETLKFISLFKHLTMKELLAVLEVLRVETCSIGEVIIREGEVSDSLYIVMDGGLDVTRNGTKIAELAAGTHFGEMALLNQRPRAATVTANQASKLLVMDRAAFNDLVRREPTLGVKFLWTFAQVLSLRLDEAIEAANQPAKATPGAIEEGPFPSRNDDW